jgi:DNA-directed RNA polymerase specialized sigma24 family protein
MQPLLLFLLFERLAVKDASLFFPLSFKCSLSHSYIYPEEITSHVLDICPLPLMHSPTFNILKIQDNKYAPILPGGGTMNDDIYSTQPPAYQAQQWFDLYIWLLPFTRRWVWNANVPLWQGQQQDIAQEAIARTFNYYQLAHVGQAPPITMLKPFSKTVAHNYFRDRRRKDYRVTHLASLQTTYEDFSYDPGQLATENLVFLSTIHAVVQSIIKLPPRQKEAVLKNLACSSLPEERAGMLEQALAEQGIDLSNYQSLPPGNPTERKREAALRYVAYKRLKKELDR